MTDISVKFKWDSVIVLDDWISTNKYKCKVYFDIETENGEDQNVAFERCKVFIDLILADSLLININSPLLQTLSKKTKQKIITLPNEPLDIVLAAVIYNKFNTICESRLIVNKVEISSRQGDDICIHFDHEFNQSFNQLDNEMFNQLNETPWWFRADASYGDWFEQTKKEIKFHKHVGDWQKELQWETVKDDSKEKISKWKPEIIHGGKTQH